MDERARAAAACEASGMATATFARRHGTTAGRLRYWRKRLGETHAGGEARLVPVRVVEPGQARLVERAAGRVVLMEGALRGSHRPSPMASSSNPTSCRAEATRLLATG